MTDEVPDALVQSLADLAAAELAVVAQHHEAPEQITREEAEQAAEHADELTTHLEEVLGVSEQEWRRLADAPAPSEGDS